MRIDVHCHAVGKGKRIDNNENQVYLNIDDDPSPALRKYFRFLYDRVESGLVKTGGHKNHDKLISTDEYFNLIYRLLVSAEEIDGIVLLALDAVYTPDGDLDERQTEFWVSNRFLSKRVAALNKRLEDEEIDGKRFFLGGSVNPNNKHWEAELDFVLNQAEAVLIKWIPSVQHILLDQVQPRFYRALADADVPLLCHVGPEHMFPEGIRLKRYDNFKHLAAPLEHQVKVIAAHCNTPVIPLLERNEGEEFRRFMEEINKDGIRLWADTSALSFSLKVFYVNQIAKDFDHRWLVHGSDFPIPADGWVQIPWLNPGITSHEYTRIIRTKNPFDRDVLIKRAHGFQDTILENALRVLRMGHFAGRHRTTGIEPNERRQDQAREPSSASNDGLASGHTLD